MLLAINLLFRTIFNNLSEIFEFANNISPFLDKRVKYKSLPKILFSMYCKRTHFDNKTTIVAPFSLPADSKGIDCNSIKYLPLLFFEFEFISSKVST